MPRQLDCLKSNWRQVAPGTLSKAEMTAFDASILEAFTCTTPPPLLRMISKLVVSKITTSSWSLRRFIASVHGVIEMQLEQKHRFIGPQFQAHTGKLLFR